MMSKKINSIEILDELVTLRFELIQSGNHVDIVTLLLQCEI